MSEFSEDYLLYLLAQASATASAKFHAELATQGVPAGEWRVLASLHPDLCLTVGELAKECLIQPSTLSRTLDRLENNGTLKRSYTKADRRQVRVELTEEGKALAVKLVSQARQQESQILKSYNDEEVTRLKETLRELIARAS